MLTLKILHVIPSVSPVRGGPSQAILEMVRGLRAQGVDADIITTDDNGVDQLDVPTDDWVEYNGVPVRFFRRSSFFNISRIKEFSFSSAFAMWLDRNIAKYELIHVHAVFSFPSTIAMSIARKHNIPYIVRPLGQLCEWSLRQSALKKKLYLKAIERNNLEHSQGLHFTSEQEKKEAEKLGLMAHSFIIPHGLDFSPTVYDARRKLREKYNFPDDEKVILFLSRIHPKKGLDYLIRSLANMKEYSFRFVLAGSGDADFEAKVRTLLKEVELDTRTLFTGFVKGEAKDILLQGADLYALTSHSENFGVAVLEALAAGLPTIVTPGVALSAEIEKHRLGYVSELCIDAITSALETYFSDPKAGTEMGKKARQFTLNKYTWERNSIDLIQLYKSVLDKQITVQYAE